MVNKCLVLAPLDHGERAVDEDFFLGQDGKVDVGLFSPEYKGANDSVNLRQNIIFLLLKDDLSSACSLHVIQFFGLKKPLLWLNIKKYVLTDF